MLVVIKIRFNNINIIHNLRALKYQVSTAITVGTMSITFENVKG